MRRKMTALGLAACLFCGALAAAQEDIPKGPCGSKPVAPPQFRKGGEGVPPLPLPATPLRRTERKRPPAPPVLIAKIQFGSLKELKVSDGILHYYDWNKDPADIPNLLNDAVERALNVHYTWKCGPLSAFTADPSQYPIYYYTGSDDFTLSDADVARLREYVRAGGVIWGDTALGDPDFFKAFVREMSKVLPDRTFHRLGADHPLFNCYFPIAKVSYNRPVPDAPNGEPVFYGMDLGARTAILLSRYGLSCGWDGHKRAGAYTVDPNDARQLGVNMIAYALAMYPISIYQSAAKIYYQEDERPRGEFVLAQARIGENWDSQFNEIANLLKATALKTSAEIKFERKVVDLGRSDLQDCPFLYITGEYDFTFNAVEKRALKTYLAAGGFILASPFVRVQGIRPRLPPRDRRAAAGPSAPASAAGAPGVQHPEQDQGRRLLRLRREDRRDSAGAAAGRRLDRRGDADHLQPVRHRRRLARVRQPVRPGHRLRRRHPARRQHHPLRDDALAAGSGRKAG